MLVGQSVQALGTISANTTITISSGGYVTATIGGALTFTFSGAPTGGCIWHLVLTNGGSAAITWPGSVSWTGGTAPTLRTSGVDILRFHSADGGTSWVGELAYDEQDIDASDITSGTLDAARLPLPTTTTIGAVKRNTGSAGQYVTGVDADGNLTYDTPAGGGSPGGSSGQVNFNDGGSFGGAPLWREDANTIAQRNGTTTQVTYWYKTTDGGANYERLAILPGAASGWMQIAAQTAGTGADNIGLALSPAGTGAISAHVPDSTAAGGNARGAYAVDWQTFRGAATRVASGYVSCILGGVSNTASANYAVCVGGDTNLASNNYSAIVGGNVNTASGKYSFVGGGRANTASGVDSWVAGGQRGTTRGLNAARAYAGSRRSADGDTQVIGQPVRNSTTSTSATTLTTDAAAVGSANVMVLPNNSGAHFRARVAAYRSGGGAGSWEICGTIGRGANAASTAIVGSTTIRTFGVSASLGSPIVDVVADTTQGAAVIQVTAGNSDTTYWVGDIELVQVA